MRNLIPDSLRRLSRDALLLFLSRFTRLFAYGSLSVVLVFYLVSLGLTEAQVGILLTLTLVGDLVISLLLTTRADSFGRRSMLIIGAVLMAAAGVAFASTKNLFFLLVAGTIGVISPSGNEVGPFLSIEQAALSHVVSQRFRTEVFAWHTLAGSLATALGALCGGTAAQLLQKVSVPKIESYRAVVFLYAVLGLVLASLLMRLSSAAEVAAATKEDSGHPASSFMGVRQSCSVVLRLSSLFALDSFAGGFVIQSFAAYWFYLRFGVQPGKLGMIFFWANIFAGVSALLASRLAARFGLVRTMVFTHLPSNILLILVPLMPNLGAPNDPSLFARRGRRQPYLRLGGLHVGFVLATQTDFPHGIHFRAVSDPSHAVSKRLGSIGHTQEFEAWFAILKLGAKLSRTELQGM